MENKKEKSTHYIIKFTPKANETLKLINEILGWKKNETVLRLLQLLEPSIKVLEPNRELVVVVRNEENEEVVSEKVYSYAALNSPRI